MKIMNIDFDLSVENIKEQFNAKKVVILLFAFAFMAFWLIGVYEFFTEGHESYNLSRAHPWGLLMMSYEFFVAISMGLGMIGAGSIVFDVKSVQPFAYKAILWGLVSLFAGFAIFIFEIGHPITMVIYIVLSGNVTSALLYLGIFYPLFMFFSVMTLFFAWKNNPSKVKIFAIGTLFSAAGSILTAGSIFGLLYAIPFAAGPFYPTQFFLTALLAGVFVLSFVYWISNSENEEEKEALSVLGRFAAIIIAVLLVMYFTRYLAAIYSSEYALKTSVSAMYATSNFWLHVLTLGLLLPLAVLIFASKESVVRIQGYIALIVLWGMMMSRINLSEGLQYIPQKAMKVTEYQEAVAPSFHYVPSIAELALTMGGFGVAIFLYFISSYLWNELNAPKNQKA